MENVANRFFASSHILMIAAGLAIVLSAARTEASTLWDESINGDLSNNQSAPNAFTLSLGTNAVIGTLGGTDHQDWIALTVPSGLQLGAVVLAAYASTDQQGFTGVQIGTNFVGSTLSAGSYLGYAHFGTGAANGSLAPTNLVGVDILPIMGNTNLAAGSQGFTPPLGSGTFTFLIQQTGTSATSYEFDYVVVPEPATLGLVALGCSVIAILLHRRRMR
jgi:hypothetical protein